MIVWIEPKQMLCITVKDTGIFFSAEAFNKIGQGKGISVGIDEEEKLLVLTSAETVGYKTSGSDKSHRIYSKDLGEYLISKGIKPQKYHCKWNQQDGLLTAKY